MEILYTRVQSHPNSCFTTTIRWNGRSPIPQDSNFIAIAYLQHAGGVCLGEYCLRSHMYLISQEVGPNDENSFPYSNVLRTTAKAEKAVGDEKMGL